MQHRIVSQDEWPAARKAHLRNEKALTRMRDLVAAERRALPWVRVEKCAEDLDFSTIKVTQFDGASL